MTRDEKAVVIEELTEKFKNTDFFYITDAGGMTVAEINAFRRVCFEKGIEYKVFKNSLIKKALEAQETDYSEFTGKVLKGFSGVLFSPESGSEPAKLLKEFRKKNNPEKPALKGASVDASFYYGEESLEALANIKSKADLIAELVTLLQSPAQNLVRALQSPSEKLASALQASNNKVTGVLQAIADKQS